MKGDRKPRAQALKAARKALAKIQENYDMAASELKKSRKAVAKAKHPKAVKMYRCIVASLP